MTHITAVAVAAIVYFAVLTVCIVAFLRHAMSERRHIRELNRRLEALLRTMHGKGPAP